MLSALLLGIALLAPPTDSTASQPVQAVVLNGTWKVHTGDSLHWADPAYDDREWVGVAVPGSWERVHPGYDGFGWYRRTVTLPDSLSDYPLGLQLSTVGDAFEVYWNGVKIGARGRFPPHFEEAVDPSLFMVPTSALQRAQGGRHLVAVRIYNDYAYGGLMGPVRVERYDHLADRRSPGDMVVGALVSFFLAIGIYHLAFFVRRRSARENLYFAGVCLFLSLYGATFSGVFAAAVIPFINPYRLGILGLLLAGPCFLALTYRLFDLRFGSWEWAFTTFFGASWVVALVLPLGTLAEYNRLVDAVTVLGLTAIVVRAGMAASPHRPHARLLVAGTAVFAGTLVYDVLSEYEWVPVAKILPGVNTLFWLGFLVFIISVGIATAGKWALTEVTALVDPLTDLARRHVFDDALRRETERLRRAGGSLALAVIDLDHFKEINDTYGHRTGDEVLARVGRLLRHTARNIDLTSRLGGEEFAVLLYDTGLDGALAFAERFHRHLREADFVVPGGVRKVTASVGIAVGEDLVDPQELMEAADRALYRAKAEGRNRIVETLVSAEAAAPAQARAQRRWGIR